MRSFAQFQTDLALAKFFPKDYVGSYLDIGAHHPTNSSNTYLFYEMGWRGICVDPIEANINLHKILRPDDLQVQAAISCFDDDEVFYECSDTSLSTMSLEEAQKLLKRGETITEKVVQTRTVRMMLQELRPKWLPDILSIDVEGHEKEVLLGCPFGRPWLPKVIVLEACLPCTTTPSHSEWEYILENYDYTFAGSCGVNRIYKGIEHCS